MSHPSRIPSQSPKLRPTGTTVEGDWLDLGEPAGSPTAAAASPPSGPAGVGPTATTSPSPTSGTPNDGPATAAAAGFEILDDEDVADYIPEFGVGQREAWRNRVRKVYVPV